MYDVIPSVCYRAYVKTTKNNPVLNRFVKHLSMDFEERVYFLYNDDIPTDIIGDVLPLIYIPSTTNKQFYYSIEHYKQANPTIGFIDDCFSKEFSFSDVMYNYGLDFHNHTLPDANDILSKIRFFFDVPG